ncbi:MAG: hypothetical protein KTR30_28905, partial [Saprospiraceae bacterium]|nr:hypothetical protein [Saprospiraceae bacterium]
MMKSVIQSLRLPIIWNKLVLLIPLLFINILVQAQSTITWVGGSDNDWQNASNWSPANVPTVSDQVIVPDVTNDPDIMSGTTAVAQSVVVEAGAVLDILSGSSLTIDGATDDGL